MLYRFAYSELRLFRLIRIQKTNYLNFNDFLKEIMMTDSLFQPIQLGKFSLKNRIVMPPMTRHNRGMKRMT